MPTTADLNEQIESVPDVAGTPIEKGDTVVAVNGQTTGRVCELSLEDDLGFVCIRPVHQAYGKGVWYAADQVFWVARPGGKKNQEEAPPSRPKLYGNTSTATKPRTAPAKKK